MKNNINFFSILNTGDKEYTPIYDNFIYHLKKIGIDSKHELIDVPGTSGKFNTEAFNEVVYKKLDITRAKLKSGKNVFCTDLDIVFLKDPIDYMASFLEDYDIVFQQDPPRLCTGFFVARPNEMTIDLFDSSEAHRPLLNDAGDQGYLNAKLKNKRKTTYKDLKIKKLDLDLFPNGHHWYKNHSSLKNPYIVHYNCQGGGARKKRQTMKNHNHWHEPKAQKK